MCLPISGGKLCPITPGGEGRECISPLLDLKQVARPCPDHLQIDAVAGQRHHQKAQAGDAHCDRFRGVKTLLHIAVIKGIQAAGNRCCVDPGDRLLIAKGRGELIGRSLQLALHEALIRGHCSEQPGDSTAAAKA